MPDAQWRARRRRLLGVNRRRTALWLIVCTLAGLFGGSALALSSEDIARATTTVLITPLTGNAFSPDDPGSDLINLNTEAQLVTSDTVGAAVARDEGDPTAMREILAGASVEVPANSQILEITATAESEVRAAARSQKFAEEFLEYRRSKALNAAEDRIERLRAQLNQTNDRLQDLASRAAGTFNADRRSVLNQQIQTLSAYAVTLRTTLTETRSTSTFPGQVITPASEAAGLSAGPPLLIAGGTLFGLALGALGAFVSDRASGRIRHPLDADALGVPVVATTTPEELEAVATNIADGTPHIPDAIRQARGHLLHKVPGRPIHLGMAHAGAQAQLPSAGVALGFSFVRAGIPTTLLDLTDDPESLAHWLGYSDHSGGGLASALREGIDGCDALLVQLAEGLRILPLGNPTEDFDDLIASPDMARLIRDLGKESAAIILLMDMRPSSRSHELLTHFPTTMLQLHSGEVRAAEVEAFVSALDGDPPLGAIFVAQAPSDSPRMRRWWRRSHPRSQA